MNSTAMVTATRSTLVVIVDGPYPAVNREGDEYPQWVVYVGDAEDDEPEGTVYRCNDYMRAQRLATKIGRDRRLDVVDDSTPA